MNITIDKRRADKMRLRLGSAVKLIDDERYLPMFRNRQINYNKEFEFSVKLAKKKSDPKRYFASLWSSKNLAKTVDWLRKLMNLAKHKAAALRQQQKSKQEYALDFNEDGRNRLSQIKRRFNLIS